MQKFLSLKTFLSYNKILSAISFIKPIPIYLALYTKICFECKKKDTK